MTLCFAKERKSLQRSQAFRFYSRTALVVLLSSQLTCFCALRFQCVRVLVCNVTVLQNNMCLGNKNDFVMSLRFARWNREVVLRSHLTHEHPHTREEFKTLFHPVSLNITSTQYTGEKKLNKTQQPDATLILFFYKKISCSSFTLKWLRLTWICIALAVVTIWFGRLKKLKILWCEIKRK